MPSSDPELEQIRKERLKEMQARQGFVDMRSVVDVRETVVHNKEKREQIVSGFLLPAPPFFSHSSLLFVLYTAVCQMVADVRQSHGQRHTRWPAAHQMVQMPSCTAAQSWYKNN